MLMDVEGWSLLMDVEGWSLMDLFAGVTHTTSDLVRHQSRHRKKFIPQGGIKAYRLIFCAF